MVSLPQPRDMSDKTLETSQFIVDQACWDPDTGLTEGMISSWPQWRYGMETLATLLWGRTGGPGVRGSGVGGLLAKKKNGRVGGWGVRWAGAGAKYRNLERGTRQKIGKKGAVVGRKHLGGGRRVEPRGSRPPTPNGRSPYHWPVVMICPSKYGPLRRITCSTKLIFTSIVQNVRMSFNDAKGILWIMRGFHVSLCYYKLLNKWSSCRWFDTP